MNILEKKQTVRDIDHTKVQSKMFDERLGMGLSDGILIDNGNQELSDYRQTEIKSGVVINQEYFQERIKNELALLKSNPQNPKILNRVGDIYFANLKFDKAKGFFKRAFKIDTDNVITANKLTKAYMVLGKIDLANQVLDLVGSKMDNNTLHLHAVIKMMLNQLSAAEKIIGEIPKEFKNYFEVINTLGLVNLMKQDYKTAAKCFEDSSSFNESYVPAVNNLAVAYQNDNRIEDAIKQYKKATDLDPNYLLSYNNLFNLLVENERIDDAYQVMVSADHLSDKDNDIRFRAAWAQMRSKNYKVAISGYEDVLALLPENSNTLNNIGYCYVRLNDAENAVIYFDRALRSDPNNTVPLKNLMEICEATDRKKESRRLANRLLKLIPNEPNALVFKGDEHGEAEEWNDALILYEAAYESKPQWMSLYAGLTHIYADLSPNYKKGIEVAEYALQSDFPNYESINNNLIHLHLVNKKIKEAEKMLSKLDDENAINLATKGLYYLLLNDIETSKDYYYRAKSLSSGKTKETIEQRELFDFGKYYYDNNDNTKALKYFSMIITD